ncbi:galactose mutarotase-like isoform X2 [Ostrea edulis]|uniref:galactose mutarotase-like isoform X2 n=1 Tax=Ostrea edulis TaxID=37623 RepID=UPI0024AF6B77|nr:galactose mutarotase-like isoform X2 [Ostrea edulis]
MSDVDSTPANRSKRLPIVVGILVAVVGIAAVVIGVTVHLSGKEDDNVGKTSALEQGVPVIPTEEPFGNIKDGRQVKRFTFTNKNNVTVRIISYGATITDILMPDKNGKIVDISLGFDTAAEYEDRHSYIGAALGRITERLKGARFTINGVDYNVSANEGQNQLHGGFSGFDSKLFDAKIEGDKVVMTYASPDGEEGFPGKLTSIFTFQLTNENELILGYSARTNKATPVNLSNHVYFNLAGHKTGKNGNHVLTVYSGEYVPLDEAFLPIGDGKIAVVNGTLFDLRKPTLVRKVIRDIIVSCYVFGDRGKMKHVAKLENPGNGRYIDVYTTEPGLDVYFSSHMKPNLYGKDGAVYGPFEDGGVCLIPLQLPSGVNMNQQSYRRNFSNDTDYKHYDNVGPTLEPKPLLMGSRRV